MVGDLRNNSLRIVHVTSGLGGGGAESQLFDLSRVLAARGAQQLVISLLPCGVFAERIQAIGVPVETIEIRGLLGVADATIRLGKRLRSFGADVVHGWMYHGNLLATLSTLTSSLSSRVVWCLHAVGLDFRDYPRATRWAVKGSALLSGLPGAVVANSDRTLSYHHGLGFKPRRWRIIHNGTDTDRFRPDPEARSSVRAELGVRSDTVLIGLYQRFHPMKDHTMFFSMAEGVATGRQDIQFVLAGAGVTAENEQLRALAANANLSRRVHFLGLRSDMERLNAALDLAVVTSKSGESFSNAVAEAMSCGVPCVVTDISFLPELVADTGRTAPIGDAERFAIAVLEIVSLPYDRLRAMGAAARERVVTYFSLHGMADRYSELYSELAAPTRKGDTR